MCVEHTPVPWVIDPCIPVHAAPEIVGVASNRRVRRIARVLYDSGSEDQEVRPNAEFIVKACNNYEEVLLALVRLEKAAVVGTADLNPALVMAKAAITKATS